MLLKKDPGDKANDTTENMKAVETGSSVGQEAGTLEILMHSIYHVSQCSILVLNFPVFPAPGKANIILCLT